MRSSTELFRIDNSIISHHLVDLDRFRVFLPESTEHSASFGSILWLLGHGHSDMILEGLIDILLDRLYLLWRHLLRMREIESETLGRDIGARLHHMISEDFAETGEHQMARGMQLNRDIAMICKSALEHTSRSGTREVLMSLHRGIEISLE